MTTNSKILSVPTNIITGFLGVGKTSAIMYLLTQKPDNERWAVLVNEFGEIGIDGSLLLANTAEKNNIFIKELPGGCMCCTAGAPMRITLNKLLKEAKPHRLFIEPTGLGHPLEVLQLLSGEFYRNVLDIQQTVTLVDARNISDTRYTQHPTFIQQIQIADVIIGNKADLYNEADKTQLTQYISQIDKSAAQLYYAEHGQVPLAWLKGQSAHYDESHNDMTHTAHEHEYSHHKHQVNDQVNEQLDDQHNHAKPLTNTPVNTRDFTSSSVISANNTGEGFQSIGWRFSNEHVFNKTQLLTFLNSLNVLRIKAIFITNEGTFSYNKANDKVVETRIATATESRIEIINEAIDNHWQEQLTSMAIK